MLRFYPKHRLGHPENYLFWLSKKKNLVQSSQKICYVILKTEALLLGEDRTGVSAMRPEIKIEFRHSYRQYHVLQYLQLANDATAMLATLKLPSDAWKWLVIVLKPISRLGHPESQLCLLLKWIFTGSRYPINIRCDFEYKITERDHPPCHTLQHP